MTQKSLLSFFSKGNSEPISSLDTSFTFIQDERETAIRKRKAEMCQKNKKRKIQQYIDVGQNSFCTVTCPQCSLLYMKGEPNDEALHKKYHSKLFDVLVWKLNTKMKSLIIWRGEQEFSNHVLKGDFDDDVVILVDRRSDPIYQEKAKGIDIHVGSSMGCSLQTTLKNSIKNTNPNGTCIFLYIRGNQVIGMLSCERIDHGYKDSDSNEEVDTLNKKVCHLGVRRIWVQKTFRRQGIGKHLLNLCTIHAIPGVCVSKEMVAFSSPTDNGRKLIQAWLNNDKMDSQDSSTSKPIPMMIFIPTTVSSYSKL